MKTDSDTPQEAAGAGSSLSSGSPSSTPRTDALMVPRLDTRTDAIMAFQTVTEHARTLERELAAAHKALMVCDGAMIGKVNPKSVAFKMVNAILRPENVKTQERAALDAESSTD